MMKSLSRAIFLFTLLLSTLGPFQAQAEYVGLPSSRVDPVYATQQGTQWCWAASIQMMMASYGVSIPQHEIVRRSYGSDPFGQLPDWPGSFQVITANLNGWGLDRGGRSYMVSAAMGSGAPWAAVLIEELREGRPVLIGYRSGPSSGHAVVVTGAEFVRTPVGPQVTRIVVRDPWPSAENRLRNGRVEYGGAELASKIMGYWLVRVHAQDQGHDEDDEDPPVPQCRQIRTECVHAAHSLGDASPCTHPAHPYGDYIPCQHPCMTPWGSVGPCHPNDGAMPCSHAAHMRGDLSPCQHQAHPAGDVERVCD